MIKKVIVFVNYNFYESKRHFAEKFAEALQRKGIEAQVFDTGELSFNASDAVDIMNVKPDFTCSFNSSTSFTDGRFFWDILKVPHVSFLVDSAIYYLPYLKSPYSILTCVDRSDYNALRAYNFDRVFFWPHAIESDIEMGNEERIYDVVFLGSCYDYESLRLFWKKQLPKEVSAVLDNASDLVLSDRIISISEALAKAWNDSGLPPSNVDFSALFFYLDYYTRGKDRVELIRSISDAKVHVFGDMMNDHICYRNGWPHYLKSKSNVVIHPAVGYTESLNILRKSKICLNSIPCFRNGSHERVFAGLGCGALPITSDSSYWREAFDIGSELLVYRSGHWNEVNDWIKDLLTNNDKREEIILKGRNKVLKEHTWDARVDQLLIELPPLLKKCV